MRGGPPHSREFANIDYHSPKKVIQGEIVLLILWLLYIFPTNACVLLLCALLLFSANSCRSSEGPHGTMDSNTPQPDQWGCRKQVKSKGKGQSGLLSAQLPFHDHKLGQETHNSTDLTALSLKGMHVRLHFLKYFPYGLKFLISILVGRSYYISLECILYILRCLFKISKFISEHWVSS